ncbi:hypothetical protein EC991_000997 [Linnemannia zychae]|nr:hypothetical protein EC991_000997 [Linnemannia zychae]
MFGFGEYHDEVYGSEDNKSSGSRELIAGATTFEVMKSVENGRPGDKHKLTKEVEETLYNLFLFLSKLWSETVLTSI